MVYISSKVIIDYQPWRETRQFSVSVCLFGLKRKGRSDLVGMSLADLVLGERPGDDLVAHSSAIAVAVEWLG